MRLHWAVLPVSLAASLWPEDASSLLQMPTSHQDLSTSADEPGDAVQVLKKVDMYFINLDASNDRRVHMNQHLRPVGGSVTRFRATDCKDLESSPLKEKTQQQGVGSWMNSLDHHTRCSAMACWWSHVLLLQKIQAEPGPELVLIMEDDMTFNEGWKDALVEALQHAPPRWSLLKVSAWGATREEDRYDSNWVVPTEPVWDKKSFYAGTAGYFVNRTNVASVLTHIMKQSITDIDAAIMQKKQDDDKKDKF